MPTGDYTTTTGDLNLFGSSGSSGAITLTGGIGTTSTYPIIDNNVAFTIANPPSSNLFEEDGQLVWESAEGRFKFEGHWERTDAVGERKQLWLFNKKMLPNRELFDEYDDWREF